MEVGEIEDCNFCIIFIYQLVVVVVVVYANGVWMTTVHSAGSSPRHRPGDLQKPPAAMVKTSALPYNILINIYIVWYSV